MKQADKDADAMGISTKNQQNKPISTIIGAVIVARMNSSRFPGKSMVDIAGKPSLEWLANRLANSEKIQRIVFATTTAPADDPIEILANRLGHACFRGSENDVLGRVLGAAQLIDIETIVHVTGDCPLIDPDLANQVIDLFFTAKADYASLDFDAYPNGFDIEVFSTQALADIDQDFDDPWIREHVTEPLYTTPDRFTAVKLPAPPRLNRPNYRICIDTKDDYKLVHEIFTLLLPHKTNFDAQDIVDLLDNTPSLVALNSNVKQTKYSAAVIGLGQIGSLYERLPNQPWPVNTHAAAYQKFGKTRLAAGSDINLEHRTAFSKDWNNEAVFETASALFQKNVPDIVSIATPVETHADLCIMAAKAGVRAIFCEKPFVPNSETGQNVIKICQAHNVLLSVNHWMRWSTLYSNIRKFLRGGGLGDIQTVRCHYSKGAMNSGTHAIDLLRFLLGEIQSIQATDHITLDTGDDNYGGVLQMAGGFPTHLTISDYRHFFTFEIDVMGTSGRLRSVDDKIEFWDYKQDRGLHGFIKTDPPFETAYGSPFESAISELVSYIDHGKGNTTCSGEDGLMAVEIIQTLKYSWEKNGTVVTLK